jgi:hypothetical protein
MNSRKMMDDLKNVDKMFDRALVDFRHCAEHLEAALEEQIKASKTIEKISASLKMKTAE